ncbi:MAG: hypothetical protein KTR29_11560 [Rhodothermaceae bacterium]|nr:hypothetical protein [Rhodothermaceae bacterium]
MKNNPLYKLIQLIKDNPAFSIDHPKVKYQLHKRITKRHLNEYLDRVVHDLFWPREIAKNSYKHELGFDKLVLFSRPTGNITRVKLHIWWPGKPFADIDIHDHRYDFRSKVLLGELRHELFIIRDDVKKKRKANEYELYEYQYNSKTNSAEQHYKHTVQLKKARCKRCPEGRTYKMACDKIHCVLPGEDVSITLLLQGKSQKEKAIVLRPPDCENKHEGCYSQDLFNFNEVDGLFRKIIERTQDRTNNNEMLAVH